MLSFAPQRAFSDGSNSLPRLRVQHSLWSLNKPPINADQEWTLGEKFARIHEAGFEAVECWLTYKSEREVADALARHDLRFVLGHRPFTVRLGAAFVFAQPSP
jgi:hypothetical protein